MKRLLFCLLLFVGFYCEAQEYQVLHVKGEIIKEKDGALLKPGDKINESDKIKFQTDNAMAAVLSDEKGRYILRVDKEEEESSDLVYVIKSAISPVRGGMSTRATGINNDIDMQLYFEEAPYVWAGETLKISLSRSSYPMSDHLFFVLEYGYDGEKVSKKLGFEDDYLVMKKGQVFNIEGNPADQDLISNYELYYYDEESEEGRRITSIDFVLITQDELDEIFALFPDDVKNRDYEIADFLSDMYGKCDPLQLQHNYPK
jgi:hypothetical protein